MKKGIGLLGCRVRPFMENSFHHGYDVRGADGFNDWDAEKFGKLVTATAVNPACYPQVLERYRDMDGSPVIFCGPVEVDPSLVERAAMNGPVLNAPSSSIAKSRNHDFLRRMAADGIFFPETGFDYLPGAKSLIKEYSSAGGVGVMEDRGGELLAGQYRQKKIDGLSVGAAFLSTRLMGITNHINRVGEFGQSGYMYGGLVYPADIENIHERAIKNFGKRAGEESGLTGWWGADFILNGQGAYLLEINPRFTASAELIAQAHDIDLVGTQTSAINGGTVDVEQKPPPRYHATAVCYAKADCVFNDALKWFELGARDIPHDGKAIKKGEPVISLYAKAKGYEVCMSKLKMDAGKLYSGLTGGAGK